MKLTGLQVRFMSVFPSFFRSLLLTVLLSFAAPVVLIGGGLVSLSIIAYLPGLQRISQVVVEQILQFLAIFGSGNWLQGLLIICLTCCLVGAMFDTYAFYRYQILRDP